MHSNIFDLNNNEMYIYHFHNFNDVVKIKLEDEMKKGSHAYRIRHLFTASDVDEELNEFNSQREAGRISRRIPEFIAYRNSR